MTSNQAQKLETAIKGIITEEVKTAAGIPAAVNEFESSMMVYFTQKGMTAIKAIPAAKDIALQWYRHHEKDVPLHLNGAERESFIVQKMVETLPELLRTVERLETSRSRENR